MEKQLEIGTRIKFLTGKDKNKVFKIIKELTPCARTEGCYTAIIENSEMTVYIYPSELKKHGYVTV